MITGDHPRTAARIAGDLGIVSGDARVLAGDEIEELDDEALGAAVGEVRVYDRVAPEHKLRIVEALQDGGNIVAMPGHRVQDAPAPKSADTGPALGIPGPDPPTAAADMILAQDKFATTVPAGRAGRPEHSTV